MTNFDKIADRIIMQYGLTFAIAASGQDDTQFKTARNALKQAIVEALENVLIDATGAMRDRNA